jgi:hypothetical protein
MLRPALAACLLLCTVDLVAAHQHRTLKLRFPSTLVPATRSEGCAFVEVPGAAPFDVGQWEIRNHAGGLTILHTLVYLYRGERLDEFAKDQGHVVFSRGCLDLGPVDHDQRQMIVGITTANQQGVMSPGVALRLEPVPATPGSSPAGLGFLIDINWENNGTRPRRASAVVLLRTAARGSVRRLEQPFEDGSAELGLSVPPRTTRSTEDSTAALNTARPGEPPVHDVWTAPGDVCIVTLAPRMHKRSRFFGVDLLAVDGSVVNPPGGTSDPFEPGRTHLYGALDYTDPGLRTYFPPMLLRAGEALHYLCWHDNGVARSVRFGCEEASTVVPGMAAGLPNGGPAKPCATPAPAAPDCPPTDANYPSRTFTGACVEANVVAGPTSDDEACAITGTYYDAAPGAQCDVSALPPVE